MNELQTTRQALTREALDMIILIADKTESVEMKKPELIRKLIFCFENGLSISAALTGGLPVSNGRLTPEGNIVAAQIKQHPNYDYKIARHDNEGCTIEIYKNGILVGEASFTSEDAKIAGLLSKATYKAYPREMYFNKAISRAYKWYCPDIFGNPVYIEGEIEGDLVALNGGVDIYECELMDEASPYEMLQNLFDDYGHQAVLSACGGKLPQTSSGVDALKLKLDEEE